MTAPRRHRRSAWAVATAVLALAVAGVGLGQTVATAGVRTSATAGTVSTGTGTPTPTPADTTTGATATATTTATTSTDATATATTTGATVTPTTTATTTTAPQSVLEFVARPNTCEVRLYWTPSGAGVKSFTVRRYDDLAATPSPTTGALVYAGNLQTTLDSTVAAWTTYRYAIWADDGAGGYLAPTTLVTTTSAQPVLGLAAAGIDGSSANVSWHAPSDAAVHVVVTRRDAYSPEKIVYTGVGTSTRDSGLEPGTPYVYRVVAEDSSGRRGPVSPAVVLTTKRVWTPTVASPFSGWPGALACATGSWCMAVDNTGAYQVMSGTSWSQPKRAFASALIPSIDDPAVSSLTCPAAGRCLAIRYGGVVEFRDGTWRPAGSPSSGWTSLDCPTTTYCVAIRRDGWSTTRGTSTWTTPVRIGTLRGVDWYDISCQVAGRCFAVASGSATSSNWRGTLAGGVWSTGSLGSAADKGMVTRISCTTTTCLGLGVSTRLTVTGTAWSMTRVDTGAALYFTNDLSCGTPSACVAMDLGSTAVWSGGRLVERATVTRGSGDVRGVSCPRSGGVCFAVDDRGRFYRWTPTTHWTLVTTYVQTTGGVNRIGCRSVDACMFVDDNGWVVSWNGTSWTRGGKYFLQPALVECSGPGFCIATDTVNPLYRVWSNGSWSAARSMPLTAHDLSCATPSLCIALDTQGRASRFNGVGWWAPVTVTPAGDAYGAEVSCTAPGTCMVTSPNARYRQYLGVNNSWTAPSGIGGGFPTDPLHLSCATASFCLATHDDGSWAQWNGVAWSVTLRDFAAYRLQRHTCLTIHHCLAPHAYSNDYGAVGWDGGAWSESGGDYTMDGDVPTAPECPTVQTCFVGGLATVQRSS